MAPAGLLITAAGALAMIATTATMTLEIVLCVDTANNSSLADACGAAAALEAVVLVMLGAIGVIQATRHNIASSCRRSNLSFVSQLLICGAAAATSIVALVFSEKSTSDQHNVTRIDISRSLLVGLAIALAAAVVFQFVFISSYFLVRGDVVNGSSSLFRPSEDQRSKHVKGIRYSQTVPMMLNQGTTMLKAKNSAMSRHQKTSEGAIGHLRASISQVVRRASSRTKLLGFERKRPTSLESAPPRTSADTSFESWDTSTVDAHNRQVVMELSSPTAIKRALETIPASPSGSLTSSQPDTPLDSPCLEPPQVLRRIESYSSSLRSRSEANRLTPDSSVNEMHIHPLFRSDSPIPPPAATPGTIVLAAPNAGLIISRSGSLQSLKRLRSGSLPVVRSPLMNQQAGVDSLEQNRTRDDKGVPQKDVSSRDERRMTPPIPEWLLSPTMKANLESFKEQQSQGGY
ncbi:hypothetical protein E4U53_001840 [Claviceps sorghi]|nr:hypothetical protein E4U53_001840 [Claviceps sorghi]